MTILVAWIIGTAVAYGMIEIAARLLGPVGDDEQDQEEQ